MKKFLMSAFAVAIMAGFATNVNAQEGFNVSDRSKKMIRRSQ